MGLFDNIRSLGGRQSNSSRTIIYASTITAVNPESLNIAPAGYTIVTIHPTREALSLCYQKE